MFLQFPFVCRVIHLSKNRRFVYVEIFSYYNCGNISKTSRQYERWFTLCIRNLGSKCVCLNATKCLELENIQWKQICIMFGVPGLIWTKLSRNYSLVQFVRNSACECLVFGDLQFNLHNFRWNSSRKVIIAICWEYTCISKRFSLYYFRICVYWRNILVFTRHEGSSALSSWKNLKKKIIA